MHAGLLDDGVDRYEGVGSVGLSDSRGGRQSLMMERSVGGCQWLGADRSSRRAFILTRSGSESAFILRIT